MPTTPWAKKLRQLRAVHNYTQDYVAKELGIRQNSYSLYETGTTEPTEERLSQIAAIYSMSLDELKEWQPGVVNQSHNNVANAYTTIEHQHAFDKVVLQELLVRLDKRSEESERLNAELIQMNQRLMGILERLGLDR
ncbi:MAG: helix-turn-helix transcriptional regulator [Flavobacteriales bacterium]|nr:helix-turn-helix transcriptional regulator [Flavobacteriales bacterium]